MSEQSPSQLPPRLAILGVSAQVPFVIKKTEAGVHHFVKIRGRWRSIPGMDFHAYVPSGFQAEARIFTWDPETRRWSERRESLWLWEPQTN